MYGMKYESGPLNSPAKGTQTRYSERSPLTRPPVAQRSPESRYRNPRRF